MYMTIIDIHVYLYISQISGERLQDHWSSGLSFQLAIPWVATANSYLPVPAQNV